MQPYEKIKAVVVGDQMVDQYLFTQATKVSQEAPVLVVKKRGSNIILGGASNVSLNINSLGAKVFPVGVIGNDYFGDKLRLLYKELNISTDGIIKENRLTTVKTRIIAGNRQLLRMDNESENPILKESIFKFIEYIKKVNPDIILVVDYDKGVVSLDLMDELRKLDKPIFINGKPEHISYYTNIDTLICNEYEFTKSLEKFSLFLHKDISEDNLLEVLKIKNIIHTRGENGLSIYTKLKKQNFSGKKVEEIDCTGASDSVLSVIALESQVSDIFTAAYLANIAGSIVVTKFGTRPITYKALSKYVKK